MGVKNYYDELGLSQTATKEEIKKKYIELTKKYHPDVTKEKKEIAEKKYASILEAYSVLGNSEKKEEYDEALSRPNDPFSQYAGSGQSNDFTFDDKLKDLFEEFSFSTSSSFGGKQVIEKEKKDKTISIVVSLQTIYFQRKVTIKYTREIICNCENKKRICPSCKGEGHKKRGSFFAIFESKILCTRCRGKGMIGSIVNCAKCHGVAYVNEMTFFDMKIPSNIPSGTILKIKNKGNEYYFNSYTDLNISIKYPSSENKYSKDGDDLVYIVSVSASDFIKQNEQSLDLFGNQDTKIKFSLKHTRFLEKYGLCVIVVGKGFINHSQKGDLILRLNILRL